MKLSGTPKETHQHCRRQPTRTRNSFRKNRPKRRSDGTEQNVADTAPNGTNVSALQSLRVKLSDGVALASNG